MYKTTIIALCLLLSPLSLFAQTDTPRFMGPICKKGETLFYGQMTRTNSEERLCQVSEGEWHFWTRDGSSSEIIGTNVTNVEKVKTKGSIGYTAGYKFSLGTDVVQLLATFKGDEKVLPMNGFIIINEHLIPLEPMSIVVKQ